MQEIAIGIGVVKDDSANFFFIVTLHSSPVTIFGEVE
jgi:hypothetical protein